MPKLKTNKAAKKRYSYTATGKVKRTKANKRHILALTNCLKEISPSVPAKSPFQGNCNPSIFASEKK